MNGLEIRPIYTKTKNGHLHRAFEKPKGVSEFQHIFAPLLEILSSYYWAYEEYSGDEKILPILMEHLKNLIGYEHKKILLKNKQV